MDKIQKIIDETGIDQIVICNTNLALPELNFFYLTGLYSGGLFEGSFLVADRDSRTILTSKLEETNASASGMSLKLSGTQNERLQDLASLTRDSKKIGLDMDYLTMGDYRRLKDHLKDKEFVDISKAIIDQRMVKDEQELHFLRKACRITSESLDEVLGEFREGVTELDISGHIVSSTLRHGATGTYSPIVAFGENAANPHHSPDETKLKNGDLVVMDFGNVYMRYNSDMTRTVVFGKASEEQEEMYDTVFEAQKLAIEAAKAGVNGKDVDKAARTYIDGTKYRGLFIHGLGHGLGLGIHDHTGFAQTYDLELKENMVLTVEPGVYVKGFGGVRIEDDIIIKKGNCEVITTAKRELVEV